MGGKSGRTIQQTQSTQPSIPGFLQPFIQQSAGVANSALGSLSGQLQGAGASDLVAGFNPDQQQSFDLLRGIANGQGGFLPSALNALQSTADGDFLFGDQGFDQAVQAAVNAAQPSILSAFGGAGRGTGGLAQAAIAQQATDAFARQFGQERGRQLNAAQLLPQFATFGAGLLGDIGAQQQNQSQRELTAPISAQESLLSAALGGLPLASLIGRNQTSTQPLFRNRSSELLGTGLAGLGLFNGISGGLSNLFERGSIGRGLASSTVTTDAAGNILS